MTFTTKRITTIWTTKRKNSKIRGFRGVYKLLSLSRQLPRFLTLRPNTMTSKIWFGITRQESANQMMPKQHVHLLSHCQCPPTPPKSSTTRKIAYNTKSNFTAPFFHYSIFIHSFIHSFIQFNTFHCI